MKNHMKITRIFEVYFWRRCCEVVQHKEYTYAVEETEDTHVCTVLSSYIENMLPLQNASFVIAWRVHCAVPRSCRGSSLALEWDRWMSYLEHLTTRKISGFTCATLPTSAINMFSIPSASSIANYITRLTPSQERRHVKVDDNSWILQVTTIVQSKTQSNSSRPSFPPFLSAEWVSEQYQWGIGNHSTNRHRLFSSGTKIFRINLTIRCPRILD